MTYESDKKTGGGNNGALFGIGVICALAGGLVGYWMAPKSDQMAVNDQAPAVMNGTAAQPINNENLSDRGQENGEIAIYEVSEESTLTNRQEPGAAGTGTGMPTISDVTTLFGSSANQYIGRSVEVRSAPVQAMAGTNSFWIGPSFEQKVLVVTDTTTMPGLSQSDRVHIVGTLRNAPEETDLVSRWGLDEDNVKELTRTNVYLDAREVQVVER